MTRLFFCYSSESNMRLLFLFGIVTLNIASFKAEEPGTTNLPSVNYDESINVFLRKKYQSSPWLRREALNQVTEGSAAFSSRLVQEVAKMNFSNFVISPLGVSLTLSMAAYGAAESSKTVFDRLLELPSLKYLGKIGFQALVDDLADYTAVKLHVAIGVFISSTIEPHSEYVETTTRAFRSPVQKINFEKSAQATDIINGWCANRTHSLVKNIVNSSDINENTSIVLANAVYFKGTWLKKFDIVDTRDRTFYLNDVMEKQVPTMSLVNSFRYGEYPEINATFVELPYKRDNNGRNMSMFIVLPNAKNGLTILEQNFRNITVHELISRGKEKRVHVHLPKFRIESEIDLKSALIRFPQERMDHLFDSRYADFSGIIDYPYIFLSKAVHKAIIEIDEEGSETAATATIPVPQSNEEEPSRFFANYPFYAIIATTDKNPLNVVTFRFMGE